MLRMLLGAVAVCAGLWAGCYSTGPADDGYATGGSGTEVVGVAKYPEDTTGQGSPKRGAPADAVVSTAGLPVALGKVFIYPKSFVPGPSLLSGATPRVHTDSTGAFRIADVPRGTLVLEVNDGSGMGIARKVVVDRDSTVIDVGTVVVKKTAALKLSIDTDIPGELLCYVGVKGTRLVSKVTDKGVDIRLGDIPTGVGHAVQITAVKPVEAHMSISVGSLVPGATKVLETVTLE